MISNRPKYLKAILFTNNLAEVGGSVLQSQCFTVQDYHYHCYRERDEQGNPYGRILSGYLDFSVIVANLDGCKYFYQCLDSNERLPFSFIFNATFGQTGRISDFDDGLITYGYVVDVKESCLNDDEGGDEQILIHVQLLLSNMVFLGSETVHVLEITRD